MSFPQVKTIAKQLEVDEHTAKRVRALMEGNRDPKEYQAVRIYVGGCFHPPAKLVLQLRAIDIEIDGHGVEAIFAPDKPTWPDMEYINLGDTYMPTVIFDHTRSRWLVMSYGDWIEREERNGRKYE